MFYLITALILLITGMLLKLHLLYHLSYFFLGLQLLLSCYHRYLNSKLAISHQILDERIFLNENARCRITFCNRGRLPVYWLTVRENLPVKLTSRLKQGVISLAGGESRSWEFTLEGRKRGYYYLGPLNWEAGDIIGYKTSRGMLAKSHPLIIYPGIVPLEKLGLPSRIPLGNVNWLQPIYQDPFQVRGVREYQSGDRLGRIHWKLTASTAKLQVHQYASTVTLENTIILNLDQDDYSLKRLSLQLELGVTTAASLAAYLSGLDQPFSLYSNGLDFHSGSPDPLSAIKTPRGSGDLHLKQVLEILARIEAGSSSRGECPIFLNLIKELDSSPGGTITIITAQDSPELVEAARGLSSRGYFIRLLITGEAVRHRPVSPPVSYLPSLYLSAQGSGGSP